MSQEYTQHKSTLLVSVFDEVHAGDSADKIRVFVVAGKVYFNEDATLSVESRRFFGVNVYANPPTGFSKVVFSSDWAFSA